MMASEEELIRVVQCKFRKSESTWLSWDNVAKVLVEQERISRTLLRFITPTIEAVFGLKKSDKRGFRLELYSNSNQRIHEIIDAYVVNRLEPDATCGLLLTNIVEDFKTNNPNVAYSLEILHHLLAKSIKDKLQIKKKSTSPSTWPLCFRMENSVLHPITRRSYQNSLELAIANSLKDNQCLPPTPRSSREEKKAMQRIHNLCNVQQHNIDSLLHDDYGESFSACEDVSFNMIADDDTGGDDRDKDGESAGEEFMQQESPLSLPSNAYMPRCVAGLKPDLLRTILLTLLPFIGGHYSPHQPVHTPKNPNTLQFGMRINGLGAYFSFDGQKHLIKDSSSFGVAMPCPPSIQGILLSWFQEQGFQSVPLTRVAAQLIIRWKDQAAHVDDPHNVHDIVTLDIASAGGLKIVTPVVTFTGSYVWRGNAEKAFRHYGYCGMVPSTNVSGRISIVFRSYHEDLQPIPSCGKLSNHVRCNQILSECIQRELNRQILNVDSPFLPHYSLCAKIISVGQSMLCMRSGGYFSGDGLGFAPSQNSIAGQMTIREREATIPGLTIGEQLPESFVLPYGSFDSLWTLGLHRKAMGTAVHSSSGTGLITIALRSSGIFINESCPLPSALPQTNLKNIICKLGCCAAVLLSNQDRKPDRLQRFHMTTHHAIYFYLISSSNVTTAQRVVSFSVQDSRYLLLKLVLPPSSTDGAPRYKCLGQEVDSALVDHASVHFENGIILRSYLSKKQDSQTPYVGQVGNGVIQYDRCNNDVSNEEELCQSCQQNREWLKKHLYEYNRAQKRKCKDEGGSSRPPPKKVR
jgi:hypothetical protein